MYTAYPNYYQTMSQIPQQQTPQAAPAPNVIFAYVNGLRSVRDQYVPTGMIGVFLDTDAMKLYLKPSEMMGTPKMRGFNLDEFDVEASDPDAPITRLEFDGLCEKLKTLTQSVDQMAGNVSTIINDLGGVATATPQNSAQGGNA